MPIFTKKFAPKVAPPRTARLNIGCPPQQEELDDFKNIRLNLLDKQLCFVDGVWMSGMAMATAAGGGSGTAAPASTAAIDDLLRMKRRIKSLEQENNLYQVKLDVLLDLLTENVIELSAVKGQ